MNVLYMLMQEFHSLNIEQKQMVDDITYRIVDLEKALTSLQSQLPVNILTQVINQSIAR